MRSSQAQLRTFLGRGTAPPPSSDEVEDLDTGDYLAGGVTGHRGRRPTADEALEVGSVLPDVLLDEVPE